MRYAVFHDYDGVQPNLFLQKRWVYSDNEDSFPAGSGSRTWYFNADPAAFDMMVSGDPNTMFDIGRVQ